MRLPLTACLLFIFATVLAQKKVLVTSPDKKINFTFTLSASGPSYSVAYDRQPVIDNAALDLAFLETGVFKEHLRILKTVSRKGEEKYELVVGKARFVDDLFNESSIQLAETVSPYRTINLVVRAFNSGLAWRYEFPLTKNSSAITLTEENTQFKFSGDPTMLALLLPNYTTSHEGEYSSLPVSALPEDTLVDLPALFELPQHIYAAVTEAALVDYAGMYLGKRDGVLSSKLSPLPGQQSIKVKAKLPHESPWRVLLLSNRLGALIESNMITSLNGPSKIDDVSWIKPGTTTFPWWNGNVVPDTLNAPGNNFVTNQYYIDFCARNNITYHTVVEYGLHQWYVDDGVGFQPGPHADVTTPVPGLNMKEICDYAKSKNVGVRVWVHWAALYPKLDSAFAIFERWGLSGMMVDFMDRDDQQMVNMQEEILQKAAKHKLHIQFHGAYRPTGLHRTYPNELTREGTLNYEVNKWAKRITPDHDLNIIFTRMLAGSTDYHLGGFRAVPDSLFRVQYTKPLMMGTRCHMLAMYVVLENYLGMVCDYPAAYEGQPGFEFLQTVPTIWDETRVLDARLHEYIVIARRKGTDWYIGAISNHAGREIQLNTAFLGNGNYRATIFTDALEAGALPDMLKKEEKTIHGGEVLPLKIKPGGGFVVHLKTE